MQQIFAAAQQALSAQQELANSELVGTAGNGAVRAVVSGVGQLLDVTIDPSVIDPTDPAETASTIADLVLAAVRDAWDSAIELQQQQLGALGGGGLGGGIGGLSDALGGGGGIDLSASACPGSAARSPSTTMLSTTTTRTTKTTRTRTSTQTTKTSSSAAKSAPKANRTDGRACMKASSST